jgi:hypothetical protein
MKTYKVYVVIEEHDEEMDEYVTFGEELITETEIEDHAYTIRDRVVELYQEEN